MTKFPKVRKAVVPAAGLGTRFLPQTKAMPKEMLPIVDKPVVQYVVEDLVKAGITDIIFVTGYHKRAIEDHFDMPNKELVETLEKGGEKKKRLLEEVEGIGKMANFYYVRQKGPYGNGTPMLNVRNLIGDEPFIYKWSDDRIGASPKNEIEQLIDVYEEYGECVMAGVKLEKDEDYDRYGVVAGKELKDGVYDLKEIVEKPGKEAAPSDLGTMSSFLFTPTILEYLDMVVDELKPGEELYYNTMLARMLKDGHKVLATEIKNGRYWDTGNKLEYLKTAVAFGVKDKEFGGEFLAWIKENF